MTIRRCFTLVVPVVFALALTAAPADAGDHVKKDPPNERKGAVCKLLETLGVPAAARAAVCDGKIIKDPPGKPPIKKG